MTTSGLVAPSSTPRTPQPRSFPPQSPSSTCSFSHPATSTTTASVSSSSHTMPAAACSMPGSCSMDCSTRLQFLSPTPSFAPTPSSASTERPSFSTPGCATATTSPSHSPPRLAPDSASATMGASFTAARSPRASVATRTRRLNAILFMYTCYGDVSVKKAVFDAMQNRTICHGTRSLLGVSRTVVQRGHRRFFRRWLMMVVSALIVLLSYQWCLLVHKPRI
jgi:hypothetical protein